MKKDLKSQFQECQKQKEEYLAGWKRERADFINYKRDEAERIKKTIKFANEDLILRILSILDNIYIAEKKLPKELKDDFWVQGFLKIKVQILDFLKKEAVEEIECLSQKFDPNFQEVVAEVGIKDKESGTIVEEVKKGYVLHGKVIRSAKVKVAR